MSLCICTEAEKNIQKPLTSMSKGKSESALGMGEDQREFIYAEERRRYTVGGRN